MKQLRIALTLLAVSTFGFLSCKKDSSDPQVNSTYSLYNYSSGNAITAGTFTVSEKSDGNAAISVQLSQGYLVPGVTMKSYLVTTDTLTGTELIYANLNDIDGSTGQATTSTVTAGSTNMPISYNDIIANGYSVKVLNGSNVQAIGKIQ